MVGYRKLQRGTTPPDVGGGGTNENENAKEK